MRNVVAQVALLVGALVPVLGACGGETEDTSTAKTPEEPRKSPDDVATIATGVYGEVVTIGDQMVDGKIAGGVVPEHDVHIYAGDAVLSASSPAPAPLRAARTSKTGFFEMELPPGKYQVCASWINGGALLTGRCARVEVRAAERVRADYCVCMVEQWSIGGTSAPSTSTSR